MTPAAKKPMPNASNAYFRKLDQSFLWLNTSVFNAFSICVSDRSLCFARICISSRLMLFMRGGFNRLSYQNYLNNPQPRQARTAGKPLSYKVFSFANLASLVFF